MYVELFNGLKEKFILPVTRVVVYDDYNNPISVTVKIDGQQYVAATVTNKSFGKILKALGINKTVVVDTISSKNLKILE